MTLVLELAILGLLKEHPMHGYDLRKRLRGDFGLLSSLSFGSLYPALARLEAAGAVHEVPSERRSPEASRGRAPGRFTHAGSIAGERAAFRARLASRRAAPARSGGGTRGRRVYELTARGDELFHQLLEAEDPKPEDGRGFALRWAFRAPPEPGGPARRFCSAVVPSSWRSAKGPAGRWRSPWRPLDRYERSLVEHASEVDRARSELDRSSHRHRAGGAAFERQRSPPQNRDGRPAAELTRPSRNASSGRARPALKIGAKERSEP